MGILIGSNDEFLNITFSIWSYINLHMKFHFDSMISFIKGNSHIISELTLITV